MAPEFDAVVVGGGLVGSALAYGLAGRGLTVAVLDEGDLAYRASRGNFGLVWVQGKGEGMAAYADWTRSSADLWPAFAEALAEETGVEIGYRKTGGLHLCLEEQELEERARLLAQLEAQAGAGRNDCRILDRQELHELLPAAGPQVVGASFSPHDGHLNPLYLLRALHAALAARGVAYHAGSKVERIATGQGGFRLESSSGSFSCERLVLAAGLGSRMLGAEVGLSVPVRPIKGQILVTERLRPFLPLPTTCLRQTEEGTLLIGDSHEEVGFQVGSTTGVMREIAGRALRSIPLLKDIKVLRGWGALRIMTPDGFPLYDESGDHPGAFSVTCHSGVTLAAAHALKLAPAILDGSFKRSLAPFSARRFDVRDSRPH